MINKRLKIVFIGRYTEGQTGIVRSIYMGLLENGYDVHEINISSRPNIVKNPYKKYGGHGPVYVDWRFIKEEVETFKPDIILFCAGGLTFSKEVMEEVKRKCTVIGLTLSDPDVFPTVSKYADLFDYHTTNSKKSYKDYKDLGHRNIHYLPFGIDSRFFEPRLSEQKYRSDVSIIGHYRPNRLEIASPLLGESFNVKIFGRDWPIQSEGPVYDDEWFKAMYSTKIIVNFPKTGAGYTNVKVGIFEAAATGRLIMTEYFDEMKDFFDYDKEIVGYKDRDDLIKKIYYYLENPAKANIIAQAGRMKCMQEHTWKKRLSSFLDSIEIKESCF
ncbi:MULTISPECIES: glycosyltransferase [Sutcliffiella]|uniref:CgeB family protein n=1 Tax=Sutcliffiella TaxID=2837511 RepID=UPI0022DE33C8|nr:MULTISPECIES: glycosyltransferase [Sutcliffiella]MED4016919.1 glycosyltransferase [Sutcliffiella cohnii]WBL16283.1 glycosyltransferase [Sutcliffiella sp. NC1]